MTKTNKAFAYITNTAREERKVARVLSGWSADHSPSVVDIGEIDHTTRERLEHLQAHLYSSCTGLKDSRLNVSSKVCSSLTAHLVRYYPHVKALAPEAPIVMRVEECMAAAGITTADMLAWSVVLREAATAPALEHERNEKKPESCKGNEHLLAVIEELIASNRAMAARLTVVEAALLKPKATQETTEVAQTQDMSDHEPKPKRRKKKVTDLSTTWYEWYTRIPRVWDSADRHKKSESRHIVAFMKLFLDAGFVLNPKATNYKDDVLCVGQ
ncbi:hypothetical protein PHMEG_00038212 [Phytophthora megakarya]|uniref:Uncharacterized protein n=1 Tax=Phytophthora megakarya TaxID=4795 RepID=A0A225UI00_9STRA|nr:hypothetical protein PHMEG_00038212 [Phytophthora megakarya]